MNGDTAAAAAAMVVPQPEKVVREVQPAAASGFLEAARTLSRQEDHADWPGETLPLFSPRRQRHVPPRPSKPSLPGLTLMSLPATSTLAPAGASCTPKHRRDQ